jgi:hypothetical protein
MRGPMIGLPAFLSGRPPLEEGPNDPNASKLDKGIAGILSTLGWVGLYVGVAEPFIQVFISGGSISNPIACLIAAILGLLLHLVAYTWPPSRPEVRAVLTRLIVPIARRRRTFAVVGVLALWTISIFQIASVRNDLDTYAMPRKVTRQQANGLTSYLSTHGPYTVTVKADPSDREAFEYAAQLFNAIHQSGWIADLNSSNDDLKPGEGLNIYELGSNSKPNDPKHDSAATLRDAFQSSGILVNGGGSTGAGAYKLYVLVGRRPIALGQQPPILYRIGRWFMQMGAYFR